MIEDNTQKIGKAQRNYRERQDRMDTIKQAVYQGPVLVGVNELAKILDMGRQTIYNQLSTGELPIVPKRWGKGKRKKVVFDSRDVEAYIDSLPVDERFTDA